MFQNCKKLCSFSRAERSGDRDILCSGGGREANFQFFGPSSVIRLQTGFAKVPMDASQNSASIDGPLDILYIG